MSLNEKIHNYILEKKEEILKSYETERVKACERGTKIHAEFEEQYYTSEEQSVAKYGLGGKFCSHHSSS